MNVPTFYHPVQISLVSTSGPKVDPSPNFSDNTPGLSPPPPCLIRALPLPQFLVRPSKEATDTRPSSQLGFYIDASLIRLSNSTTAGFLNIIVKTPDFKADNVLSVMWLLVSSTGCQILDWLAQSNQSYWCFCCSRRMQEPIWIRFNSEANHPRVFS